MVTAYKPRTHIDGIRIPDSCQIREIDFMVSGVDGPLAQYIPTCPTVGDVGELEVVACKYCEPQGDSKRSSGYLYFDLGSSMCTPDIASRILSKLSYHYIDNEIGGINQTCPLPTERFSIYETFSEKIDTFSRVPECPVGPPFEQGCQNCTRKCFSAYAEEACRERLKNCEKKCSQRCGAKSECSKACNCQRSADDCKTQILEFGYCERSTIFCDAIQACTFKCVDMYSLQYAQAKCVYDCSEEPNESHCISQCDAS